MGHDLRRAIEAKEPLHMDHRGLVVPRASRDAPSCTAPAEARGSGASGRACVARRGVYAREMATSRVAGASLTVRMSLRFGV
jgi:hypothetical protein